MKIKTFFLFIPCCLLLTSELLYAQTIGTSVINSAGRTSSAGDFNLEWSAGELSLVSTMQNSIIITHGVLQPLTERAGDVNSSSLFSSQELRVYPNPASSFVEINFMATLKGTVHIHLYNSMGQLIFQSQFTSNGLGHIERIGMETMASAQYFLQVTLDPAPGSVHKKGSYKIIKVK